MKSDEAIIANTSSSSGGGSEGEILHVVGVSKKATLSDRMTMGLKKIFRKLTCRQDKQGQNELQTELMETETRGGAATTSNQTRNSSLDKTFSKESNHQKRRSNKNKWKKGSNRYMHELQQQDPFSILEVTGKYLDVKETFSPKPRRWITGIKFVIFTWVSFITIDEYLGTKQQKSFYLATFDHWSALSSVCYLLSSVLISAIRPPSKTLNFHLPTVWHKITWSLFSIAAPSQLLSTLAFWIFDFKGDDWDSNLVVHGSVLILLFMEGLMLNRTPMRINHQWFFLAFVYTFLLWSLIHSYSKIGNPTRDMGERYLYPFLDWNQAPIATALNVVIILLLVCPFLYWLVWMMSLFSFPWKFQGKNRRYLSKEESQAVEDSAYLEGIPV